MNAVIVVTHAGRKSIRKFREEGTGRRFYKMAQQRFSEHSVNLISLTLPIEPTDEFTPSKMKGVLYCPYCGKERKFRKVEDEKKCTVCGISTRDFYVKTYNHLWEHITKGSKGKKRVGS